MRVEDIKMICNLGTGTMGHATALMFALAGYQVRMYGRTADSLERGYQNIDVALATYCRRGRGSGPRANRRSDDIGGRCRRGGFRN